MLAVIERHERLVPVLKLQEGDQRIGFDMGARSSSRRRLASGSGVGTKRDRLSDLRSRIQSQRVAKRVITHPLAGAGYR